MRTSCHLAQSTNELESSAAHRASAVWIGARLASRAERMRALTAEVHTHVLPGPSERPLSALADRVDADLIVIAATTKRDGRADLLAQHSRTPVLVVGDEVPFVRWASQLSPLRIVAALSGPADVLAVLRSVSVMADAAPCEVTLVHVASGKPELAIERFAALLREHHVNPQWKLHVEAQLGPRAPQILAIASARDADVLVTGSRAMARVSRLWERSVSRSLLNEAKCSVLCVPLGAPRERKPIHSALAATDLTYAGDAALVLATRVVAPGGVIHAVHVLPRHGADRAERALAHLEASAHAFARRDLTWKVHVVYGDDIVAALELAARQLAVDAVCVTGKAAEDGGATLARLLAQVRHPVLIADPPHG